MQFNDQARHVILSPSLGTEILRYAQDDRLAHLPMLVVTTHYRLATWPITYTQFIDTNI